MRRITLAAVAAAVALAAVTAAPATGSPAASIGPHVYSTKIAGATPAVLDGTWRLTVNRRSFSVTKGATLAVVGHRPDRRQPHHLPRPRRALLAAAVPRRPASTRGASAAKRLTLTAVREPCTGRKTILTKPFTRIL